jgi:hypothetical protein
LDGHFCRSFSVIENCILTQISTRSQWEYYRQLVVDISIVKIIFKIMDGESLDSQREPRRGGGAQDPDIIAELEQGELHYGHGGSRGNGSGFSLANGASAQVSVHTRGTFRVPSVIGGASAGSRSIIPTGNYFDDTTRRSRRMVAARKVVCPKGKRGDQGSRDYSRHHSAATAAITELFGAAKHFRTKNADGELSYKYKDIQSEYVGNLDKLKLFRKRMEAFDMFDPFLIPTWIDPNAISVLDRWGDRKVDSIDLTKHWSKVSLEHVCAWQRDTFDWCKDEDDLTSMEWVKEFLTNSCDINLVKRLDEKFEQLFEYEQGGITYLKLALDEMFTMSNMVITSLQKFLKQFAQEGVAKVPNEDVRLCAEQIAAVCARLAEVDALPQEVPGYILEGFTRCSVVEFREIHKLLYTTDKVRQMRAVSGRRDSSTTLAAVQKLCSEANDVFHSLNLTNKWNIPQGHRADAVVFACDNCGSPAHASFKCPLPRDEARITKAKEARTKSYDGRGSGGRGRGRGRGRGDGRGGRGSDHTNTRGKWGAAKGDPANPGTNTVSDGVENRNGKWMMNCKSCGWNETHTSGFHSMWKQNQSTFCIPSTHSFWAKSGTTPSSEKVPTPAAAGAASSGVSRGQLSGLINRYKTETDDGMFSSFLSEFEGLLN